MGNTSKSSRKEIDKTFAPALTPESREQQMISLATDRAEQQLRDGTASPSVIVHYLKLGTTVAQLETEKLKNENMLLKAKTEAYESAKDIKELYSSALDAMRIYGGRTDSNDED